MVSLEGTDALNALAGSSGEVSPLLVLFLVHRLRASGRLWMTRGVDMCAVDFSSGEIDGCTGFTTLIDGVDGERSWSVTEWADAMTGDVDKSEAFTAVMRAICGACARMGEGGDWMLNFVASDDSSGSAVEGVPPLGRLVSEAITSDLTTDDVRAWFEGATATGLAACRPTDAPAEAWNLDGKCLELLTAVESGMSTGALFVEIGAGGWSSLGVLWKLGLVSQRSAEQVPIEPPPPAPSAAVSSEASAPSPEPAPTQRRSAAREAPRAPRKSQLSPDPDTQERQRRQRPKDSSKKKRRRDPRVVAIKRDPGKSPTELVESHLKEAHEVLTSVRPEFVFRLKKTDELARDVIDKRHREACARYHPDRFRNSSQGVQALAEGCFTAVSEAFHRLIEPEYLEALRIRFVERETGTKVVTEKTRSRARVDFAKGEALFKQKRYADAHRMAVAAVEGDPDKWQYQYLQFRSGFRSGQLSIEQVEPGILGLQGMTTVEKADQLYTLGELLLKDGQDDKAYKMFAQAVSLDGQNVGASRRLRLRDRRQRDVEEKSSSGGLFGGLFQRRK